MAASVITAIERERKKSRKQIIEEHYENRTSFPEIVSDLGVSEVWVRQLLKETGYKVVRVVVPDSAK